MAIPFTIEDAKLIQRAMRFKDHVVYMDLLQGFVLAHTDEERRARDAGGPMLSECEVHKWLAEHSAQECGPGGCCCFLDEPGWYTVQAPHEVKAIPW